MSAVSAGAEVAHSDESHFTPEHISDAAYRKARGRSWERIAADLQHPNPDRLRRTMEKDEAYHEALKRARRELRDELEADAFVALSLQLSNDEPGVVHAAAKLILEHTTKQAERDLKERLEGARAKARLESEAMRAASKGTKAKCKEFGAPSAEVLSALLAPEGRVVLWDQENDFRGRAPGLFDIPMRVVAETVAGKEYYYVVPLKIDPPLGGRKK